MSHFVIRNVTADGSTIEYEYDYSDDLRRFFTDDAFFVEYDVDVEDVPESIQVVPLLANACPVAWASGADVHVPAIDREFRDSLRAVQRALADMYPRLVEGGEVVAREVVDNRNPAHDRFDESALLFSGGVDSLTTYLRHRTEEPSLVGVHGADIYLDQEEAWRRTRAELAAFGDEHDVENLFVRANMRSFVDTTMLLAHYRRHLSDNWFSCVQHGLGLLGLCAPLTVAKGIGTLYIAATHSEAFAQPWGSHPDIDDQVAWANTTCRHDGYDRTRQEKLGVIADYVREEHPELEIRSCYEAEYGGNCNRCEKCARTQVGLLLAGLDPNEHGYAVTDETFERIREQFENADWVLGEDERFMWEDIQNHASPVPDLPYAEAETFCEWLAATDVEDVVERSGRPPHHRLVQAAARNTPYPVYASLYPVYASLSPAYSSLQSAYASLQSTYSSLYSRPR